MLRFRNIPLAKKVMVNRRGGWGEWQDFPSKFFCLTLPKNSLRKSFSVSLISAIEKIYASAGYVTIFRRIFFSDSAESICRAALQCFVSEKFR